MQPEITGTYFQMTFIVVIHGFGCEVYNLFDYEKFWFILYYRNFVDESFIELEHYVQNWYLDAMDFDFFMDEIRPHDDCILDCNDSDYSKYKPTKDSSITQCFNIDRPADVCYSVCILFN